MGCDEPYTRSDGETSLKTTEVFERTWYSHDTLLTVSL
jgi:hypothetical protein